MVCDGQRIPDILGQGYEIRARLLRIAVQLLARKTSVRARYSRIRKAVAFGRRPGLPIDLSRIVLFRLLMAHLRESVQV